MKHCGKSSLGQRLARRWSCALHDTDDLLAAAYADWTGRTRSVREIAREEGADLFALLEAHVVAGLYLTGREDAAPHVVSAGGRTVLNAPVGQVLKRFGRMIYLQGDPDELYRRTIPGGVPSFLDPDDPRGSFHEVYRRRHPRYLALADATVDLAGLDLDESFAALLNVLGESDDGR
jgi:shikimate kinase